MQVPYPMPLTQAAVNDRLREIREKIQALRFEENHLLRHSRKPAAEQPNGMGEEFGDPEPMTDEGWMMAKRIKQA